MKPADGVLVLAGYDIRLAVERGYLAAEDGFGDDRCRARFSKIDNTLRRVVILGNSGSVTLNAVTWLHDVGVPLIQVRPDGTLVFVSARSGAHVPALRRNQCLVQGDGRGLNLARDLVRAKVEAQCRLLDRLPPERDAGRIVRDVLTRLDSAEAMPDLRILEAVAAKAYWKAWLDVVVRFAAKDRGRRPDYWQRFGNRASPLLGQSPRKAINPANAMLNYLYAILEAEARVAALAVGLDPMLGFLHTDQRARDSLALDLMEPVRPQVDAYLLDLLANREFQKEDFFELRDGQCRLLPPLTGELIQTSLTWARAVLPIAQHVARQLSGPGSAAWGVSPRPRRGQRVVMREPDRLTAIQARSVPDPRRSAEAGAKRRAAMRRIARENHKWDRANGSCDPGMFATEFLPKIRGLPLRSLMEATGLTKSACSRIRSGLVVPHSRHWRSLLDRTANSTKVDWANNLSLSLG